MKCHLSIVPAVYLKTATAGNYSHSPHIYTSTIWCTHSCHARVIFEKLCPRALKGTYALVDPDSLETSVESRKRTPLFHARVICVCVCVLRDHTLVWWDGRSYDVEESGWLRSFFPFVFFLDFFFPLQGLQMQHRMQGEARRRSGEVTNTMRLTPTRIPTTWRTPQHHL